MKSILTTILLLIPWPILAAELAGATTATVGETVWVEVSGEPDFDGDKTVGENLDVFRAWLATTRFQVSSPENSIPTLEPDVQIRFSFTDAALVWDLRAKFVAPQPGVYVVAALIGSELALHRLEAGGTPPTPPTPPDPPNPPQPPVTTGPAYLIVLAVNQDLTVQQSITLTKLRAWADSNPTTVSHLVLSPGAASTDARVKAYLDLVPDSGQLPYCFITRARTDQAGAAVLWSGPLPATAEDLIATVQGVTQ